MKSALFSIIVFAVHLHNNTHYQAVRQESPLIESSLVLADTSQRLLNNLLSTLQASTIKFESYLEKRCRNLSWVEKDFLNEVKCHQQRLRKDFFLILQKRLMDLTTEQRALVQEKAEKEYPHIEVLMDDYYQVFYKRVCSERGIEVAPAEKEANPERRLVVYPSTSAVLTPDTPMLGISAQTGISSLHGSKEWIQSRRRQLEGLIKENSMPLVKELLHESLEGIKSIIDPQLKCYKDMVVSLIEEDSEQETASLQILDHLQSRLKSLLQGGFLLFNTDHVLRFIHSEAVFQLITQYSQAYLQQSRLYLEKLQSYQQRLKRHNEQRVQTQAQLQILSELSARIDQLYQSFQDMCAKFSQDYADLEARMEARFADLEARIEVQRAQNIAEREARWMQRIENIALIEEKRINSINQVTEQERLEVDSAENLINRPSF